jgi:hypothetical protein
MYLILDEIFQLVNRKIAIFVIDVLLSPCWFVIPPSAVQSRDKVLNSRKIVFYIRGVFPDPLAPADQLLFLRSANVHGEARADAKALKVNGDRTYGTIHIDNVC